MKYALTYISEHALGMHACLQRQLVMSLDLYSTLLLGPLSIGIS